MTANRQAVLSVFAAAMLLLLSACSEDSSPKQAESTPEAEPRNVEETQGLVLLRGLPTLETGHRVALVELAPGADNFGQILMLRHVQVEAKHYIQGFKLNEAELIHRIETVAARLMAMRSPVQSVISVPMERRPFRQPPSAVPFIQMRAQPRSLPVPRYT